MSTASLDVILLNDHWCYGEYLDTRRYSIRSTHHAHVQQALMQLPTNISAVSTACGAAYKIFSTIDRIPPIDVDNEGGIKPATVVGEIEFKNVQFKYPTRPGMFETPLLHSMSIHH